MTGRTLVAGVLLLAATILSAQPQPLPPGKWWQRPEVVKDLALSNEQQDRLDNIFRAAANELIDLKAEADKLQVQLRGELDRTQLRRAEIKALGTKLSDARSKLFERELTMLLDMRAVLSDRQWEQMRSHLEREDHRRGGPPGGRRQPPH
ncbi:MAG TPA: periplasmic heavy metal sensor [Thermoanaerobaculia bacterium]|jgi:Spy/CpxP family protein refolding chaperone